MISFDKQEETAINILLEYGQYLTHLTITNYEYPKMFDNLISNCQNIIHFDIYMIDNKKENLKIIISNLFRLLCHCQSWCT